jgi:hypothetical protein
MLELVLAALKRPEPYHIVWLEWLVSHGLPWGFTYLCFRFSWRTWCGTLFITRRNRVRDRYRKTLREIDDQIRMLRRAHGARNLSACDVLIRHIEALEVRRDGEKYMFDIMREPAKSDILDFATDQQIERELRKRRRWDRFRRLPGKSTALVVWRRRR